MTGQRRDHEQRPHRDLEVFGWRWRHLDLVHDGATFLRRRGIEHSRFGGVLLHRLDGPDPGLDLHDHPWSFTTLVLRGGYSERYVPNAEAGRQADRPLVTRVAPLRHWRRWSRHDMPLATAHRIVAVEPGTVTLVWRRPKVRRWGFFLPTGWIDCEAYPYDERRPVSVASNKPDERRHATGQTTRCCGRRPGHAPPCLWFCSTCAGMGVDDDPGADEQVACLDCDGHGWFTDDGTPTDHPDQVA